MRSGIDRSGDLPDVRHVQTGAEWRRTHGVAVLVHGRDREPDELLGILGPSFGKEWRLLAPKAPRSCWYPMRYNEPGAGTRPELATGVRAIDRCVELAASKGVPREAIITVGFSQGGCLVAEHLLSGRARVGAAVVLSGALPEPVSRTPASRGLSGTDVAITGAQGDPWIAVEDLDTSAKILRRSGAEVALTIFADADHVIRPEEIRIVENLIGRRLAEVEAKFLERA